MCACVPRSAGHLQSDHGEAAGDGKDVRRRIVEALHRSADLDARHITLTVEGGVVTLTGRVGSFVQYDAAACAAASAPGITRVDNRMHIGPIAE